MPKLYYKVFTAALFALDGVCLTLLVIVAVTLLKSMASLWSNRRIEFKSYMYGDYIEHLYLGRDNGKIALHLGLNLIYCLGAGAGAAWISFALLRVSGLLHR